VVKLLCRLFPIQEIIESAHSFGPSPRSAPCVASSSQRRTTSPTTPTGAAGVGREILLPEVPPHGK
jgi:hypothetical protein